MSESEQILDEAIAMQRLATNKLEWCDHRDVLKRYAGIMATLEDIRKSAEIALRGAVRHRRMAEEAAERERGAA